MWVTKGKTAVGNALAFGGGLITVVSVAFQSANTLLWTFDKPLQMKTNTPSYFIAGGQTPLSADQTTAFAVLITYTNPISAGIAWSVPADPVNILDWTAFGRRMRPQSGVTI